ncbi:FecCD family ABC transporter permease [Lactococcus formosensis]|jgi:iron complex transport system permease protein|uniref:FecCD family ABC transporter permease n=1 Tax=Lactococcus formosensis TaxID=1281486 RepID=UPI001F061E60|nr:iron ABC transporter permease [Lactococcus formosensis]MCH1723065.1 iron ABC transporter permease [Lactococcus formosensis]MDG6112789.1 iron ABC transporter permease [Lactococcus formosensis]MDG6115201.1 iron ABC transporter permease [Lactococcus formosensis]MDG6119349.1 iron ABC transporter permease [Lactococcus formosensis]MDG6121352.1 iron ABC transporter permease [Lactococcus formosensis]
MKIRKFSYQVALALVTIMVLSFLYLMLGDQNYSFSQIWHENVVLHLRLPRLLALMFVGILLSSSGLLVQSMTNNPIAEISTLGISGGASFALALVLVFNLSTGGWLGTAVASLGAFVALVTVAVLTVKSKFQPIKVVLVGTSVGLFATSLASILTFYSKNMQSYFLWIVGSFSGITPLKLEILMVVTVLFVSMVLLFANQIKVLAFGEEMAISLGISVNRLRLFIMVMVALASGVTVSSVGVISFVGLMAPHLARRIVGGHFLKRFFMSNLLGVLLLLVADLLARNLFKPYEFPAGSLTLLFGAIFFIYMMSQEGK